MQADEKRLRQVEHVFDPPLIRAKLLRRYKRFLADVEMEDGSRVTIHCPNSGSMKGCLEDGAVVYMSPSQNPKRRTPYTWEMIQIGGNWIGVNTGWPNYLAARAAELEVLPLFQDAVSVRREVKVSEHTRLDLMVELPSGPLYVEVKNVSLVRNGQAHFPDAKTTRGAKHLEELMALKSKGFGAAMLYTVQRPDGESFAPAQDIDPDYARLMHMARKKGVEIVVVEVEVSPVKLRLRRSLPLADWAGV
jgi:sugar fermentation stimulation protein A